MKGFKSILLVYDMGPTGKAAIERATALVKDNQTRLTVVTIVEQLPYGVRASKRIAASFVHQDSPEPVVESEQAEVNSSMETLQAHGIDPDIQVLVGVPFLEITKKVLRDGHDLVIVSAEGKCGVRERLLGSPAVHLMRTCPCPIWVLRSGRSRSRGGILAALEAENEENDDLNLRILDCAYWIAQRENREIHVLHPRLLGEECLRRDHSGVRHNRETEEELPCS